LVDLPAIGCAKTKLVGQHSEPDSGKGSFAYLRDQDKIIGAAVRTRDNTKPLCVSIGHRISLNDSIKIILKCCAKYRIPEPIRRADALARRIAS
jgi:deoxyribonuclease V